MASVLGPLGDHPLVGGAARTDDVQLNVQLLPETLFTVRIDKSRLRENMHALIKVLFFPDNDEPRFFNYLETPQEISLVVEQDLLAHLPVENLEVDKEPWRCLRISEGASGYTTTVVDAVAGPLAEADISIFYLSTFTSDFVLVPAKRLPRAIAVLTASMRVLVEGFDGETPTTPTSTSEPTRFPPPPRGRRKLISSNHELSIATLDRSAVPSTALALINILFYSAKGDRFFSYTDTTEEISLVMSSELVDQLPRDSINVWPDKWIPITFADGQVACNESGVMHSVAQPLTLAGLNLFYVFSFSTGHVLIREVNMNDAVSCLESKFDLSAAPDA